jgi:hypothetical protein
MKDLKLWIGCEAMHLLKAQGFDQDGNEIDLLFLELEMFTLNLRERKAYLYYAGSFDQGYEYWIDPTTVTVVRELTSEEENDYLFKGHKEVHHFYRKLDKKNSEAIEEIDKMFPLDEDLLD